MLISDVLALFQIEAFIVMTIFVFLFSLDDNFVWNYSLVRFFSVIYFIVLKPAWPLHKFPSNHPVK